jgi:hypothetical protein
MLYGNPAPDKDSNLVILTSVVTAIPRSLRIWRCMISLCDTFYTFSRRSNIGKEASRGRCYDHNFLRFFPIFGEKIGVFLKYQSYDQLFSKFSFVLSRKNANFFAKFFGENI